MVAAGGIAARCVNRHANTKPPTQVSPVGLLADSDGRPLNLQNFALPPVARPATRPYTVAVVGTSMNAGKTTTGAALVRGLTKAGLIACVGKVTGTGAGCDRWCYLDAGANETFDFTDFGYASTYRVPKYALTTLLRSMSHTLSHYAPDVSCSKLLMVCSLPRHRNSWAHRRSASWLTVSLLRRPTRWAQRPASHGC